MITMNDAVAMFLRHREVKHVSPATLRLYRRRLQFWMQWREDRDLRSDLSEITADELRTYLHYLLTEHIPHATNPRRPASAGHLAIASVQSDWRILRALWTFLTDEEVLTASQQKFFLKGRVPCPQETDPELRQACPHETFDALIAACESENLEEHWRNQSVLLLLANTGARVSEIVGRHGLRDSDVALAMNCASVRGKGGRRRWVYWTDETGDALAHYLLVRRGTWGGTQPLFRGMSSRNDGEAFTADALRSMLRRLAQQAGITLVAKAPIHSLRHGFAHAGLDAGIDTLHLQQLLGHQSPVTTARYVREHPRQLRAVYDRYYQQRQKGQDEPAT